MPTKKKNEIKSVNEVWSSVILEDGQEIRVKLVFSDVFVETGEDGKPLIGDDGSVRYQVMWTPVVHVVPR